MSGKDVKYDEFVLGKDLVRMEGATTGGVIRIPKYHETPQELIDALTLRLDGRCGPNNLLLLKEIFHLAHKALDKRHERILRAREESESDMSKEDQSTCKAIRSIIEQEFDTIHHFKAAYTECPDTGQRVTAVTYVFPVDHTAMKFEEFANGLVQCARFYKPEGAAIKCDQTPEKVLWWRCLPQIEHEEGKGWIFMRLAVQLIYKGDRPAKCPECGAEQCLHSVACGEDVLILPCPTCEKDNSISINDKRKGRHCEACADKLAADPLFRNLVDRLLG